MSRVLPVVKSTCLEPASAWRAKADDFPTAQMTVVYPVVEMACRNEGEGRLKKKNNNEEKRHLEYLLRTRTPTPPYHPPKHSCHTPLAPHTFLPPTVVLVARVNCATVTPLAVLTAVPRSTDGTIMCWSEAEP